MTNVFILKRRGNIAVPLCPGLTVTVSPIGGADRDNAQAVAAARLAEIALGRETAERYGLTESEAFKSVASSVRFGVTAYAIELGIAHIKAWSGPMLEDGVTPAPVEPAGVVLLFNEWAPEEPGRPPQTIGDLFLEKVRGLRTLEAASGNASTASPGTSTGEAVKPADAASLTGNADPASA